MPKWQNHRLACRCHLLWIYTLYGNCMPLLLDVSGIIGWFCFFPFPFNLFTQMSSRWMVCVCIAWPTSFVLVCAHVCLIVLELPSSLVWCGYYNQYNLVLTLCRCRCVSELCYLVIYVFWAYWKFEMTHCQKFCIISISNAILLVGQFPCA